MVWPQTGEDLMDPEQALYELTMAIRTNNKANIREYTEALLGWLESGGFKPRVNKVAERISEDEVTALNAALRRAGLSYIESCKKVRLDRGGYATEHFGQYFGIQRAGENVYSIVATPEEPRRWRPLFLTATSRNSAMLRFFKS